MLDKFSLTNDFRIIDGLDNFLFDSDNIFGLVTYIINSKFDMVERDILHSALKFVVFNSTSNLMPYHNLNHTLFKFYYSFIFFRQTTFSKVHSNYDKELFELLLADLFHDFSHSGGFYSDSTNIKVAINGFKSFMSSLTNEKFPALTKLYLANDLNYHKLIENVSTLIRYTEYPYNENLPTPLTIQQQVIRDSDLFCMHMPISLQSTVLGLGAELGKEIKDSIQMQINFIRNVTFNTKVATFLHDDFKLNALKILHYLQDGVI